jgi:hypothetical protein
MRIIAVLFFFLFWSGKLFSQDLAGEWKGSFRDDRDFAFTGESTTVKFYFSKINDTTFQAYSVTYIKNKKAKDSAICILKGGFLEKNILYLEETRAIKPFPGETSDSTCLQLMKLNFYKQKKQLLLTGEWGAKLDGCGYGTISLIKKL